MTTLLDETTLRAITRWLQRRPASHGRTESAALVEEFGISTKMAGLIRSLAQRDDIPGCGCCGGVGDHPCGLECEACGGSGRRVTPVCTHPHGIDCRCDWAEDSSWS